MHLGVTAFLTDRSMTPAELAVAADERGFHSLYLPEHTHIPLAEPVPPALVEGVEADQYARSLDPFVALATAAAVTDRILLGTGVCLVALHDPIVLAKQIATLDLLSGGRFVLGAGYGWNAAEVGDHGVPFADRRKVAHENVRCMQAIWAGDVAEFHGERIDVQPSYSWPKPLQLPRPPILFGGAAGPSLFAAIAELADGWMPIGGAGVAKALPRLRDAFARQGREMGRVVPFGSIPEPGKLEHFVSLGIDEVVLRIPSGPAELMLPVLDAYARFVGGA